MKRAATVLLSIAAHGLAVPSAVHSPAPTAVITVNTAVTFQEMDGLGVSQAFQRAEDVFGKYGLSEKNTSYVLDLMFSVEHGAGFSILRNGIGSSNSSTSNLMNTIEPTSPGSPNAPPHYTWDRNDSGQFPLAVEAQKRGISTLYGDAWSAPGYMKTNDDDNNGGLLCGVTGSNCSTGDWREAYANYLVQWARFYHQSGVDVTHLGFLNEPQNAFTYASMQSNGTQAADFIPVLAKAIKKSGLDLKITCCDGQGWEEQEEMMDALKAGPDPAINYIDVITGHGYDQPPTSPLSTPTKTWESEWADLTGQFTPWTFWENGAQGEGLTWASRIQVAFVNANVSGFLYWIGAENSTTNSGLINLHGDSVIPSKRFWSFAQFSKFARPGSRRVQATSSDALVTVSAFLNKDHTIATQVINNATVAYEVELKLGSQLKKGFKVVPYLTDNYNNLTALAPLTANKQGGFTGQVPARSLVSFVLS